VGEGLAVVSSQKLEKGRGSGDGEGGTTSKGEALLKLGSSR